MSEVLYLLEIAFKVASGFRQRIASEFFEKRASEHDGGNASANNARRGNDANIGARIGGERRLARGEIDRFERPPQRRNRLQKAAHAHLLPIGHAALEAAGAVVAAIETPDR